MTPLPRAMTTLFLTLSASGLLACGFIGEKVSETVSQKVSEEVAEQVIEATVENEGGGQAKVDLENGQLSVQTAQGQFVVGQGSRFNTPTGFPEGLEAYPGASITSTMSGTTPEGTTNMLVFQTPDAPDKVIAFYKAAYEDKFKNKASANSNGALMLMYSAPDSEAGIVINAAPGADGKTEVSVTQRIAAAKPAAQ